MTLVFSNFLPSVMIAAARLLRSCVLHKEATHGSRHWSCLSPCPCNAVLHAEVANLLRSADDVRRLEPTILEAAASNTLAVGVSVIFRRARG